jgi:hypothetical protein
MSKKVKDKEKAKLWNEMMKNKGAHNHLKTIKQR